MQSSTDKTNTQSTQASNNECARIDNPAPDYATTYGSNYDRQLDIKEIAKIIRKEIRLRVKTGALPQIKASVRIDRFAGGQSIDIYIKETDFPVLNPERVRFEQENPHSLPPAKLDIYTPMGRQVLDTLEALLQSYNFDGSDSMTDYFHVNFYGHASYECDLTRKQRAEILIEQSE